MVAPNSPSARAQVSTVPAAREGQISGSVTRKKTVLRGAPRLRAASSRRWFIDRSPDSTVITKNGTNTTNVPEGLAAADAPVAALVLADEPHAATAASAGSTAPPRT